MAPLDRKYVVFKADDWDNVIHLAVHLGHSCTLADFLRSQIAERELTDAVVLRKQDIFTSSALYEYAGQIRTTIEIIEKGLTIDETPESLMMRLRILADQFADAAEDAERYDRKVPD